jgi:hypothetical protein
VAAPTGWSRTAAAAAYNPRAAGPSGVRRSRAFASAAARNLIVSGVMTESLPKSALLAAVVCLLAASVIGPRPARADAGPPFLTNDPGTPGNGNWEINIGAVPTILPGSSTWQLPQLDLNYGVGDRVQLTAEIPYVVQRTDQGTVSGWGNAFPGVKWRFFDQGEDGWQISTFPMYETAGSASARREGFAVDGPRLFLPVEVGRKVGSVSLNFEAGTYVPWHGDHESIVGFVVGHQFTTRLDLNVELYDDRVRSPDVPDVTTLDVGGRYKLHRGFNLLFMAGRSIRGNSTGQVEFMGYFGVQILLSDYGRALSNDP